MMGRGEAYVNPQFNPGFDQQCETSPARADGFTHSFRVLLRAACRLLRAQTSLEGAIAFPARDVLADVNLRAIVLEGSMMS